MRIYWLGSSWALQMITFWIICREPMSLCLRTGSSLTWIKLSQLQEKNLISTLKSRWIKKRSSNSRNQLMPKSIDRRTRWFKRRENRLKIPRSRQNCWKKSNVSATTRSIQIPLRTSRLKSPISSPESTSSRNYTMLNSSTSSTSRWTISLLRRKMMMNSTLRQIPTKEMRGITKR